MASSRPIVAGEDYTPDDINNLRSDVLDPVSGHKHNGTDGARVPFANLDVAGASGSGVPTGGTKSYNNIVDHMNSNNGVHGLPSGGSAMAGSIVGLTGGVLLQAGSAVLADSGDGEHSHADITFDIAYSSANVKIICSYPAGPINIATSGFMARANRGDAGKTIYWIAVGKKT